MEAFGGFEAAKLAVSLARLGTFMTMCENWEYRDVQDFDKLAVLWEEFKDHGPDNCTSIGNILRQKLSLPIVDMDPAESEFFKHHYRSQHKNLGIMIRE